MKILDLTNAFDDDYGTQSTVCRLRFSSWLKYVNKKCCEWQPIINFKKSLVLVRLIARQKKKATHTSWLDYFTNLLYRISER